MSHAEITFVERLFNRVGQAALLRATTVPGAGSVHKEWPENRFFRQRGYGVLKLPTGQGLVVKR